MKNKFRIKIETNKGGGKKYYAEEKSGLFWKHPKSISKNGIEFDIITYSYDTINEAEDAINRRCERLIEEELNTVISIEYKYV